MRSLLTIILFLSIAQLNAQELDSLQNATQNKLDSISSLSIPDRLKSTGLLDSLNTNPAASLESKLDAKKDSIEVIHKLDSSYTQTQHKIDSLSNLGLPTDKYEKKLDSLTRKYPDSVKAKVNRLKAKAINKLDSTKQKLTSKLSGDQKDQLNDKIPSQDAIGNPLDGQELPEGTPELDLPLENNLDEEIGELKPDIDNPVAEDLNGIKSETEEIKGKPKEELNKVEGVGEVTAVTTDVSGAMKDAGEINSEIEKAKAGDSEDLEKRGQEELQKHAGEEMQETAQFDEIKAQLDEQIKTPEKYKDQEFVKQRILEKSKFVSNDVLGQYRAQVELAQKQANLKDLKDVDVDSLVNKHEKAHPYRLKDAKFRDRILAGIIWEITNFEEKTRLDLAPMVGFKYNMKLNFWASYMYRIRLTEGGQNVNQNNAVYGPRLALSYDVWKGFYFRTTAEMLRANDYRNVDDLKRTWQTSIYLGFGKDYKLAKHINGDLQVLYNVSYKKDVTPFPKKFNLRFGFYFDFKKRPPKPEWKKKLKEIKK